MHNYSNTFEVQKDFNNILTNTFNSAVLMQHAFDFHFSYGATSHRREQNTTQCIA